MRELKVSINDISDDGMAILSEALQHTKSLTRLMVAKCGLSAKGTVVYVFKMYFFIFHYIKLKSRPSVRIFLVEWIFAVDAMIHVKLARNEAPVFWEHEVCFYNVLNPAVRHLRRFECQGVDDSCLNFTYIPANRNPDTIDNIYYICVLRRRMFIVLWW